MLQATLALQALPGRLPLKERLVLLVQQERQVTLQRLPVLLVQLALLVLLVLLVPHLQLLDQQGLLALRAMLVLSQVLPALQVQHPQ